MVGKPIGSSVSSPPNGRELKMTEEQEVFDEDEPAQDTTAILNCLEYLKREAINSGLNDAAQLISLAAKSVAEAISRQDGTATSDSNLYPGFGGSGLH